MNTITGMTRGRLLCTPAIPHEITFSRKDLVVPYKLSIAIGLNLTNLFIQFQHVAATTFRAMRVINYHRQHRFRALCPREQELRQERHNLSIDRMMAWRKDYHPRDPTLASSAKIPREAIELTIQRSAYERWSYSYMVQFEDFQKRELMTYRHAKIVLANAVHKAKATGVVFGFYEALLTTYYAGFLGEMGKWDQYPASLTIPSFDEIVEELYQATIECVEDGEEVYRAAHRSGTDY
ncbi:hypothetical protein BJX99DRAFT_257622 [Aspergillus californicus]